MMKETFFLFELFNVDVFERNTLVDNFDANFDIRTNYMENIFSKNDLQLKHDNFSNCLR